MNYIDTYYFENDTCIITWGALFPDKVLRIIKNAIYRSCPDLINNNTFAIDDELSMNRILVRILIPQKYRLMNNERDITDTDRSQFNRYFNFKERVGIKRYKTVKYHIITEGKPGAWNFYTFDFTQSIKESLTLIFNMLSEDFVNDYKKDVIEVINSFEFNSNLRDYKEILLQCDFETQITALTAIASTWSCWEDSKQDADDLALFLIPSPQISTYNVNENEWVNSQIKKQTKLASNLLNEATIQFESGNYLDATDKCLEITKMNLADDKIIGKAYFYLAICCHDYNCAPINSKIDYEDFSKKLLRKAKKYGYLLDDKEQKEYDVKNIRELLKKWNDNTSPISLLRPIKETHGTARIIYNSKNRYFNTFFKSIPKEMQENDILVEMILAASTPYDLVESIKLNEDLRYLLIDDSPQKNYQDLLFLLNGIRALEDKENNDNYEKSPLSTIRWERITIYIRTPADQYSSLIDTALKILGDFTIKVFIIDDFQWSAQYLLYKCPLFTPIKYLPKNVLKNNCNKINYTIICDGNIDLTIWLIREAFWLGCFYYPGVTLAINLISTNADEVNSYLRFECPDMFNELPDSENTSKVLPLETLKQLDKLSSPELITCLNELNKDANAFNFYVVNAGNDIRNLNYGIKIREWSIRNLIEKGKKPQNNTLPTIAFYCQDDDVANLSEHMIVQNIDCGDMWYNNYNLVPFGMLSDRYSWDNIDGGYLEKVAQSTHLQYCGLDTNASKEEKIKKFKDYFSQSYNRDSSLAVALSMPYRLFQTSFDKGDHIVSPDNLSTEKEEFNNYEMAKKFDRAISDATRQTENINNLVLYEHSRWLRWIISRGWKKATPEEVILYMSGGNPKQQLFIARMHGCICSFDDLKLLSREMCNNAENKSDWNRYAAKRIPNIHNLEKEPDHKKERKYTQNYNYIPKDFASTDMQNIKSTSDIIKTSWFDNIERDETDTQK